jgi:hypothetical protein
MGGGLPTPPPLLFPCMCAALRPTKWLSSLLSPITTKRPEALQHATSCVLGVATDGFLAGILRLTHPPVMALLTIFTHFPPVLASLSLCNLNRCCGCLPFAVHSNPSSPWTCTSAYFP